MVTKLIQSPVNLLSFFLQIREAALCGKLTGRQLFLRDASLNLSDFAVMQAAGNVEIDESLFDEVSLFY